MKYIIALILTVSLTLPCLAQDKKLGKGDFNLLVNGRTADPTELILQRLDELERKVDRVARGERLPATNNKPQFLASTDGGPRWILSVDGEYYRNEKEYVALVSCTSLQCQPVTTYQYQAPVCYPQPMFNMGPAPGFGFGGGGGGGCSGGS